MGGPSRQCEVCNRAQSKYKCPSCLLPYCSLSCFKTHKETLCVKPESTQDKSGTSSVNSGSVNDAVTSSVKPESTIDAVTPVSSQNYLKEEAVRTRVSNRGTSSVNSGSVNDAVTSSVKPESTIDAVTPVSSQNYLKEEAVRTRVSNREAQVVFVSYLLGAKPEFQVERKLEVDDPSEVLQIMQMQAIASSDEVREALKDEHLRKLISDIDSSPDALNFSMSQWSYCIKRHCGWLVVEQFALQKPLDKTVLRPKLIHTKSTMFPQAASSDEVREALKDEHLRKLISDIDSSPDALNELDKAMGVDVFRIFSDNILSAINP
ncbi:uncharacterized protein LOC120171144 [Hibiscus syriacus]|uniref:uncharacterized protein LOC120171144 n=1 Tax=Hibiscus syriacus TaxID=106335 RepID=UPI001924CCD5|nr:uncharacterized protein LOC120171144 [Hibiscus syriacus]